MSGDFPTTHFYRFLFRVSTNIRVMCISKETTDPHSLNQSIQQTLVEEGIIKGRDKDCGKWKNVRIRTGKDKTIPIRFKCGNIHSCPICRYRHIENIQRKHYQLNSEFTRQGGRILTITFTIPHHKGQSLEFIDKGFRSSMRRLKNSNSWRGLKHQTQYQYHYDRHELKYSERNGFHLHDHITYGCLNHQIEPETIKSRLHDSWVKHTTLERFWKPSWGHGIDVVDTRMGIHSGGRLPEKQEIEDGSTYIPKDQISFTVGEIEKILYNYKSYMGYSHPHLDYETCKRVLTGYRGHWKWKKYTRIYFDPSTSKWIKRDDETVPIII